MPRSLGGRRGGLPRRQEGDHQAGPGGRHQIVRIAHPKSMTLQPRDLEPAGIDAEAIRLQGFDKVWDRIAPVPSVLCYGSENIDGAMIRELLDIVHRVPG